MSKPDLMKVYVTPAGQPFRDDGESSLVPAFGSLKAATNNTTASAAGVQVSGLYFNASTAAISIRTA